MPPPLSKSHLHASWNLRGTRQPEPAACLSLFHSHSLSPTRRPGFASPSLFSPSPHSLSPPQQLDWSLPLRPPCTSAPLWLFTRYLPVALSAFSFFFFASHPKCSSRQLLPIFFSIFLPAPPPSLSLFSHSATIFPSLAPVSSPSSLRLIITFTPSIRRTYTCLMMRFPSCYLPVSRTHGAYFSPYFSSAFSRQQVVIKYNMWGEGFFIHSETFSV